LEQMMTHPLDMAPDFVPVLSAGRHRNPRKGACFMELASYLAGERWSDHPSCTHPLLALLARAVNDTLSDDDRSQLLPLVPSVVGLTGEDITIDLEIALRCGRRALPIASASRQNVIAVGLLSCERVRADLDGSDPLVVSEETQAALSKAPDAEKWARQFARDARPSLRTFRRQTAPNIVAYSVQGIATACVEDAPGRLVDLLRQSISDVSRLTAPSTTASKSESPRTIGALD
jgi:hypothetical protein